MTTPNGPVLFNSSSGSDYDSSGLGPASAVTGYGAELDGTATIDVSMDGADLTTMSAGDLLFCYTSSGRQFSIIASVDTINETITTDDAWPTESGVAWAVGGKRATLENSKQLLRDSFTDGKPELHLETDQTTSTGFYATTSAPMSATIRSSDGTQRTITQTASYYLFLGGSYTFENLKLVCSNATPAVSLLYWSNGTGYAGVVAFNCHFAGGAQTINAGGGSYGLRLRMQYCEVSGFTSYNGAIYAQGFGSYNKAQVSAAFCYFHDNTRDVGNTSSGNTCFVVFNNCIFDGTNSSGGTAIGIGRANYTETNGCIFYNYSGNGWYYSIGTPHDIKNCLFVNCGNAFNSASLVTRGSAAASYFYNNTNNYTQYTTNYFNDVELTADPFTDAAAGDFSLNSDAGGGATLRAASQTLGATTGYPFNWLTDGSGGGGGGSTVHPLYAN